MSQGPKAPANTRTIRLKSANDNGRSGGLGAKVLIPKDLPVTQSEIEVFAALLDDLICRAANDNEGQPE